jgi:hypothetical protein
MNYTRIYLLVLNSTELHKPVRERALRIDVFLEHMDRYAVQV